MKFRYEDVEQEEEKEVKVTKKDIKRLVLIAILTVIFIFILSLEELVGDPDSMDAGDDGYVNLEIFDNTFDT